MPPCSSPTAGTVSSSTGRDRALHTAVCVASLTEVKNHATLLRAWAVVRRSLPHARLTLAGDGPLRESLRQQVQDLGIEEGVAFAGLLDDVRPPLHAASVFVLPSSSEALPLSLLEPMAAGCAPVASAVGGIPDVIEDGVTGRLVPPGDATALSEALLATLQEAASGAALGERARASIVRRFGLTAWLDRIEEIYRRCGR